MRVKRIWTLTVTILTETKQIENDRKCYQPRRLVDMLRYYQFDFVQVRANLPLPHTTRHLTPELLYSLVFSTGAHIPTALPEHRDIARPTTCKKDY